MYAAKERREETASGLLSSYISQFHLFCLFSLYLSLFNIKKKYTDFFLVNFWKSRSLLAVGFANTQKRELQNDKKASNRGNLLAL